MPKVSVVIAMYNAEKTINRCMDSIVAQTLTDIEIIVVDDGSNDSSVEIIGEYAKNDERIRLIQQENAGPGAARNTGLASAAGDYVVFWDSDDCFEAAALEHLYERAINTEAEVVVCGASRYYAKEDVVAKFDGYLNTEMLDMEQDTFNIASNPGYILNFTCEAAWNKMFKRSFVQENNITFPAFRNGEDAYFTFLNMCLATKIAVVDEPLIIYTKDGEDSLTSKLAKAPLGPFKVWGEIADALNKRNCLPERSFVNRICGSFNYLLNSIDDKEALETAFNYLKEEGLSKVHIVDRDPDYYYKEKYRDFAEHILHDSFTDYLFFRNQVLSQNMREYIPKLAKQREKNANMRAKIDSQAEKLVAREEKIRAQAEILEARAEKIRAQRDKISRLDEKIAKNKETIDKLRADRDRIQKYYNDIKASMAYRLGNAILWLPKKIKGIFKKS